MTPDDFLVGIAASLGGQRALIPDGPDSAPAVAGSYALLIELAKPLKFAWRNASLSLDRGCYVYAGSARGPGGIRARLRHHLRRGKRPHWHVDHLTNAASGIKVVVTTDHSECDIAEILAATGEFSFPVPGFGSSDCRQCFSHLLRLTA